MKHDERLDRIADTLDQAGVDTGEPCSSCGAPGRTEYRGFVFGMPDIERCEACGRMLDSGRPVVADHAIRFFVSYRSPPPSPNGSIGP